MDSLGPRSFNRSVLRSHVDELRRSGLFDAVRAVVPDELAALLDTPRDAPAWIAGARFDELNAAVHRLRGRDGLRDLLSRTMQAGIAKVLEPIIHVALTFVGGSPASLFSRFDSLLSVNSRGVQMTWKPASPSSGTMHVRCGEEVPPISWIAWEGIYGYVLDLVGVTGTVGEARPAADGRSCEISVSWEQKAK